MTPTSSGDLSFQIPLLNSKRKHNLAAAMMDPGPLVWSQSAASMVGWRETQAAAISALLAAVSIAWFGRSFAVPCLEDPCARTQGRIT